MKRILTAAAIGATAILGATVAQATTFNFTGVVQRVNDGANNTIANIGTLAVGDLVSGRVVFDETAAVGGPITGTAIYTDVITSFSLTIDGLTWTSPDGGDVRVRNDDAGSFTDLFAATTSFSNARPIDGPQVAGLDPARLQFAAGISVGDILSSTDAPSVAQIIALGAADDVGTNLNFVSFSDGSDVRFTLSSVSAVPLPAGLPLMLGALGALAVMRRRA